MSASPNQSYYEIALTNRQVMSIFVVLLICILAAFLGGVWLGRDADAGVEIVAAQSINAVPTGDAPLEELDFFTRRKDAAEAADTLRQAPAKNEKRAAPVKSEPRSTQESGSSAPPPMGPANEPPMEPANRKAPVAEVSVPKAEDSGVASKPARRPPAAELRDGDEGVRAAVPESLVIQVFSSNEKAQAQRVVEQLLNGGYPAILSPVEVAGRTLHRVRIGPYTDADEAQVVAESVRRTFKLDTWITR